MVEVNTRKTVHLSECLDELQLGSKIYDKLWEHFSELENFGNDVYFDYPIFGVVHGEPSFLKNLKKLEKLLEKSDAINEDGFVTFYVSW